MHKKCFPIFYCNLLMSIFRGTTTMTMTTVTATSIDERPYWCWASFNLKLDERVEISMYKMRMLNSSHPSWRAPASLRLLGAASSDSRGPWRASVDKVHVDVATAKISKSDQWRQVERGASRTPLVVACPHAGHSSRVHFEVRAPKDKLLFRGGHPALKPLQSALRSL